MFYYKEVNIFYVFFNYLLMRFFQYSGEDFAIVHDLDSVNWVHRNTLAII